MAEKRSWDYLPDDCWELVVDRLNQQDHHTRHLKSVSLVCKRLLSMTNYRLSRLTINDPMIHVNRSVSGLLHRFHRLKHLDFVDFNGDLNRVILEIAASDLSLEALNLSKQGRIPAESLKKLGMRMSKSLKILICSRLLCLFGDVDLSAIALSFPYLEELDISYPQRSYITDGGIKGLASSLRKLRKLNISGNKGVSDHSLTIIVKKCEVLSEITALDCAHITEDAISNVIRENPNIVSLTLSGNRRFASVPTLPINTSCWCAKALRVFILSGMTISDKLLLSIEEANIPLQKLALAHCNGFTSSALSSLLSKYQSLKYLDLERSNFLTDRYMESLSPYFQNLTFISVNSCSKLTVHTFYTLATNCFDLEEIQMERTGLGNETSPVVLTKNSKIRSLKIAGNISLHDETLTKLVSVCPNLISLDVSHCFNITEHGIKESGRTCSKIRELKVNSCLQVKIIGTLEFPKLEVLQARRSGINDEELSRIGRYCTELLCLDLEGCFTVSDRGLKEVVGKCKRLRELNLKDCRRVNVYIADWMVLSRPSLRKIILTPGFDLTEKRKDLYWGLGCMIYNS
ncbi:hypothetical protein IFM89_018567 [Coptis chinensis]|uniref:Uncharacterized protein n=1 Tax=Coptis chinensis TaxID=261450 RepID=A0A835M2W6_9MAGN|nr:hypothetical protein IFM89_018567 [Coptis chinensis]